MNVIGIIAEYNPFHAGHHIHISMTRALVGKDCPVIAVMSGGFVQRGDFAIFNKWARAEAAVMTPGGADLVLEIQTPFANATAEKFARLAAPTASKNEEIFITPPYYHTRRSELS